MRYFLLLSIRIYWIAIPKRARRSCLFRESCSHFVFNITKQYGLKKGLESLIYRIKNCNTGTYLFINPVTSKIQMRLPNSEIIDEESIAEHILKRHIDLINKKV